MTATKTATDKIHKIVENIPTGEIGVVVSQRKNKKDHNVYYNVFVLSAGKDKESCLKYEMWRQDTVKDWDCTWNSPVNNYANIANWLTFWTGHIDSLIRDGYKYREIRSALNIR